MRTSEDQEKDKFTLKCFWSSHFVSIESFFWEVPRSRRLCLGPEFFQKSQKSERYQVYHSKRVFFFPSMYTVVHQNVITRTLSTSPVYYFRPWSQLRAVSFKKVSGESSACQVAYLSLAVCELHEIPEREGNPVVVAVPWLSTNIGSRQATLAAKKAWIQWSTAKRFENSSSWKRHEQALK